MVVSVSVIPSPHVVNQHACFKLLLLLNSDDLLYFVRLLVGVKDKVCSSELLTSLDEEYLTVFFDCVNRRSENVLRLMYGDDLRPVEEVVNPLLEGVRLLSFHKHLLLILLSIVDDNVFRSVNVSRDLNTGLL